MASIEGHQFFVLTVGYPGGCTRQLSLHRERVAEVRHWLRNYQELKEAHFEQSLATRSRNDASASLSIAAELACRSNRRLGQTQTICPGMMTHESWPKAVAM